MGQEEPEAEDAAVEQTTEEERLVKICPNTRCAAEAKDEWNFCAKCGQDLLRTGTAAKKLGISFAEEDIQDYLFKGFVSRELKLLGKHSVLVKSSQAEDLAEIDNYIMNGGWAKDDEGKERRVSDFYMRSMNGLCVTAAAVMKLDGDPIGETLEQRIAYLSGKGSAFVDLLTTRVTLFNRALTEYLQKIDNVLGS